MLQAVKLNILIPLQFNVEDFSKIQGDSISVSKKAIEENRNTEAWYHSCFYDKPLENNFQKADSPLLQEGRYQMKRVELDAKFRTEIGIQKNATAVHTLEKCNIDFKIGKIRILFTKCGIAFAHFELNAENLTENQALIFANAFKDIVSKQPRIMYKKKISKDKAEPITISFKEIVTNLLDLQSYLPLALYGNKVTTFIQIGLIGNLDNENKLKFFNSIQALDKREKSQDIDKNSLYEDGDKYISKFVGDRTVCIYGDTVLCRPDPQNIEFVTNTTNGLLKTATENYATIYAFYISVWLLIRKGLKENISDIQIEYVIKAHVHLAEEPKIRKFFEECLWKHVWNLNEGISQIEKLKDEKSTKMIEEGFKEQGRKIDHLSKQMEEHDKKIENVSEKIENVSEKVDFLVSFVRIDLKEYLENKKKEFNKIIGAEELCDKDREIGEFIQQTAYYIDAKIKPSGSDIVEQERKNLEILFGEKWNYLMQTSQTSLVSSGALLKQCVDIDSQNFDFSGICICATSALEAELKRIFFDGLLDYMVVNYGEPDTTNEMYKNWPDNLLSIPKYQLSKETYPKLRKKNHFTMGNLPYLFGEVKTLSDNENIRKNQIAESEIMKERMSEYLATIVQDTYKENSFEAFYSSIVTEDRKIAHKKDCFVWKCEKIRNDYRNKAAHVNVMSKEQAACCYQSIIQRSDIYTYNAEITGVLLELFNKIDGRKLGQPLLKKEIQQKNMYIQDLVGETVELKDLEITANGGLRGIIVGTDVGVSLSKKHLIDRGIYAKKYLRKTIKVKLIRWDENAKKYNAEWMENE